MFLSFCCVDATHPPAGRGGQKAAQTGMLQGCQQSEESHKSLLSTKNFQHRPSISSIYPFPSILDPYSIHIPWLPSSWVPSEAVTTLSISPVQSSSTMLKTCDSSWCQGRNLNVYTVYTLYIILSKKGYESKPWDPDGSLN